MAPEAIRAQKANGRTNIPNSQKLFILLTPFGQ